MKKVEGLKIVVLMDYLSKLRVTINSDQAKICDGFCRKEACHTVLLHSLHTSQSNLNILD